MRPVMRTRLILPKDRRWREAPGPQGRNQRSQRRHRQHPSGAKDIGHDIERLHTIKECAQESGQAGGTDDSKDDTDRSHGRTGPRHEGDHFTRTGPQQGGAAARPEAESPVRFRATERRGPGQGAIAERRTDRRSRRHHPAFTSHRRLSAGSSSLRFLHSRRAFGCDPASRGSSEWRSRC